MPTKIINVLRNDSFEDILGIFNKAPAGEVIFVLPKKHKAFSEETHFSDLAEAARDSGKSVLILASNPETSAMALKYNVGVLVNETVPSKPAKARKVKAVKAEIVEEPVVTGEVADMTEQKNEEQEISVDSGIDADLVESDESVIQETSELDPHAELQVALNNDDDDSGDQEPDDDVDERQVDDEPSSWQNEEGTPAGFEHEELPLPEAQLAAAAVRRQQPKSMTDIIEPPTESNVKINVPKKFEKPLNVDVKKEKRSAIDDIEGVWAPRPAKPVRPTAPPRQITSPRSFKLSRKTTTYLGGVVVALFVIAVFMSTGSADIIIKPRTSDLDFSLKVTASDKYSLVDPGMRKIPGQLFSVNKKVEQTFQSSGERDVAQKAKGKITVYNEYGTATQTLIATTRFESSSGMIFRTLKTVTVPGTTVKNGEITPGKIDVEVIADKAGDAYNIAAGKFTIPGFKEKGDMDRYNKFYGESTETMRGGIVGKAKVVTDQDYINAKETVSKKLISDIEAELHSQASGLKILTLSAPEVKEVNSNAQPDEAADSFVVSETAEIKTIAFKESDLYDLISLYIGNLNNLMILPEKLNLEFKDVKFNKDSSTLEFNVFVKGPAYAKIDKDKIIKDLIGKDEASIKDYVKGIEGIASARVILSPFWVRKVPANQDRIKFELEY
jgi:hypothetical protein